jgi:hypothetical protein
VRWRHGDTLRSSDATTDVRQPAAVDLQGRLGRLSSLHPSSADYANTGWDRAKALCTDAWQRHQERWPRPEGKTERTKLDSSAERQLAAACEKIEAAERHITGWLRSMEADHPGRRLAGLEFRLKDRDRLIDKAAKDARDKPDRTVAGALTLVPDAVRYTLCYNDDDYSSGVVDDIARLRAGGFEMLKFKNYWGHAEYRGINSHWCDGTTGQRFEVQFHTDVSFEAKQLTHGAYERIREPESISDRRELRELHDLQRKVTSRIPEPPRATDLRSQP